MTAAKDYRITVRMSPEMGAWLEEQAKLREIDVTSYVRMRLAEIKNGQAEAFEKILHPPLNASASLPLTGNGQGPYRPSAIEPDVPQTDQQPTLTQENVDEPDQPPPVDVNAIVYQTLGEAEAKGLTHPRAQDEDDEDSDHIPGMPRTVMARGSWKEGGNRKHKEWANR